MCRARRKAQESWIWISSIFNTARREKILFALPYPYVSAPKGVPRAFWSKKSQQPEQGVDVLWPGGPAGDEADGGAPIGERRPGLKGGVLPQVPQLLLRQDHELLVGGRVGKEGIALFHKARFQAHGQVDGAAADLPIEPVGKERVELDPQEPPLGHHGALLLDHGGKMGGLMSP